ncbi:MAG TPA: hypothetical protein VGI39_33665 [Polyangiaceae bacterium]|jgi:hypothetical protein
MRRKVSYPPSPFADSALREVRAMLRFMRNSHRTRITPRLEAFERVVGSWCTAPPSFALRRFTVQRLSVFRDEAFAELAAASAAAKACPTRPEWRMGSSEAPTR